MKTSLRTRFKKFTTTILPAGMLMLGCAACNDSGVFDPRVETIHQQHAVTPDTVLTVKNINGDVTIIPWEEQNVDVVAQKRTEHASGHLANVEIQITPGHPMRVETVHLVNNPNVSVSYEIRVPAGMIVHEVKTVNGNLAVEGTTGNTRVETGNGTIVAHNMSGHVTAVTINGKIKVWDIHGVVHAIADNGTIEIRNTTGISRAVTKNGAIDAEIAGLPEGDVRLSTSNGRITVYLAPELDARLDLQTNNGEIVIDGVHVLPGSNNTKTTFTGQMGNGGSLISARTSNHDINVYALR